MKIKKAARFRNPNIQQLPVKFSRFLLIVVLLLTPVMAQAQLELYGKFNTNGTVEPVINYYGSKKISKKFALTFFGLVRQQWSQALIGGSYLPTPDINLSASAGIEHGQRSPRYSASVWIKHESNSFLLLAELGSGHQNYLYKINLFHQFSEKTSIGIMDWRYHGLGLNFRYTISKIGSTLWIMPAYDHEQQKSRIMLGYSFQM